MHGGAILCSLGFGASFSPASWQASALMFGIYLVIYGANLVNRERKQQRERRGW